MYDFLSRIVAFEAVARIVNAAVGAGLCFGALKWRKGLLTTTAVYWGAVLGGLIGLLLSWNDAEYVLTGLLIGAVIFPVLTYTVAGVNRFVLGFIVAMKLTFMATTVMAKSGSMGLELALMLPVVIGTITGLILMAWTQVRVSAFVSACAFVGASQVAPVVSKYVNQFLYGITEDITYLFDPVDFLFSLVGIELTDKWMLLTMVVLMPFGIYAQLKSVKAQGFDYSTPLIVFETREKEMRGKIVPQQRSGSKPVSYDKAAVWFACLLFCVSGSAAFPLNNMYLTDVLLLPAASVAAMLNVYRLVIAAVAIGSMIKSRQVFYTVVFGLPIVRFLLNMFLWAMYDPSLMLAQTTLLALIYFCVRVFLCYMFFTKRYSNSSGFLSWLSVAVYAVSTSISLVNLYWLVEMGYTSYFIQVLPSVFSGNLGFIACALLFYARRQKMTA